MSNENPNQLDRYYKNHRGTQDDSASTLRSRDDKSATDLIVFNHQAGGNTSATLGANSELTGCLFAKAYSIEIKVHA